MKNVFKKKRKKKEKKEKKSVSKHDLISFAFFK